MQNDGVMLFHSVFKDSTSYSYIGITNNLPKFSKWPVHHLNSVINQQRLYFLWTDEFTLRKRRHGWMSEAETIEIRVVDWHAVKEFICKLQLWQFLEHKQWGHSQQQTDISPNAITLLSPNLTVFFKHSTDNFSTAFRRVNRCPSEPI